MSEEKCSNCKFSKAFWGHHQSYLRCVRRSPVITKGKSFPWEQYPSISENDYCGEWIKEKGPA